MTIELGVEIGNCWGRTPERKRLSWHCLNGSRRSLRFSKMSSQSRGQGNGSRMSLYLAANRSVDGQLQIGRQATAIIQNVAQTNDASSGHLTPPRQLSWKSPRIKALIDSWRSSV